MENKFIIGKTYSGKEIRDIVSKYESQEGSDMESFANESIRLKDNYILGQIDIQKLIESDTDLESFISDEYNPNDNVEYDYIRQPILLGKNEYSRKENIVLDGYHRVLQALYNKDKKIVAFINLDSADKIRYFDKGGLIAPNGKLSNLTPVQYELGGKASKIDSNELKMNLGGNVHIGESIEFYERTYADGTKERFSIEDYEKNIYPLLEKDFSRFVNGGGVGKMNYADGRKFRIRVKQKKG